MGIIRVLEIELEREPMTRVYLSLGSNMGDRQGYLQKAVKALNDLPETEVKVVSSYYETAAWGLTDQLIF